MVNLETLSAEDSREEKKVPEMEFHDEDDSLINVGEQRSAGQTSSTEQHHGRGEIEEEEIVIDFDSYKKGPEQLQEQPQIMEDDELSDESPMIEPDVRETQMNLDIRFDSENSFDQNQPELRSEDEDGFGIM